MYMVKNMRYRLTRQTIDPEIIPIVNKGIKSQKIPIPRLSKAKMASLAAVCQQIAKNGLPGYLVCKKLGGKLGYGIFLHPNAKPIVRGQIIGSYAGETSLIPQNQSDDSDYAFSLIADLRLTKQEQMIFDPIRPFRPNRLYALDLDAAKKGNFTRFINHSDKPNVEAHLLRVGPNSLGLEISPLEIIYIAKKTIRPGEQILVCYEDEEKSYWGVLKIKPFPMTPQTFRVVSDKPGKNGCRVRLKQFS